MSAQINRINVNTLQFHDARLVVNTNICVEIKNGLCRCIFMMHDRMSAQINRMDVNTLHFHDERLNVNTNLCVGVKNGLCHCIFMMHDRMTAQISTHCNLIIS